MTRVAGILHHSSDIKQGEGTGEMAETGIILEFIFPTTNCVRNLSFIEEGKRRLLWLCKAAQGSESRFKCIAEGNMGYRNG